MREVRLRPEPAVQHRDARVTRRALGRMAVVARLAGCGYSLHGNLPDRVKTVAVPVFVSRTAGPAVENFLTQAVVQAFSTNGRLRVVKPAEADAILEGEVVGYQVQALAFDPRANIQQYRLLVTMNLKMRDARTTAFSSKSRGSRRNPTFGVAARSPRRSPAGGPRCAQPRENLHGR